MINNMPLTTPSNQTIRNTIDQLAQGKLLRNQHLAIEHYSLYDQQIALARCYEYEFNTVLAEQATLFGNSEFYALRVHLERGLLDYTDTNFLSLFQPWDIQLPASNYLDWLKQLIRNHYSFIHTFYTDFLANHAQFEDIRYYLAQESTLDPRFDDLIALIQIGIPVEMKMELANNYWDEMGNGKFEEVHSTLFGKTMQHFNVTSEYINENILFSSLVCSNLSSMLTLYRENFAKAIGYFGVTEYCVPSRFKYFIHGCRRIGVQDDVLDYHILHETIDSKHAIGWFAKVILPMVKANPEIADDITKGALLRLNSSAYYLDVLQAKYVSSTYKDARRLS